MPVERVDTDDSGWLMRGVVEEHLARYKYAVAKLRGKRVADIACGTGYGTVMLAKTGVQCTGVDVSEEAIATAKRIRVEGAEFLRGDATSLPFPDRHFDTIVSFETIEHVTRASAEKIIAEFARLLPPGGRLVISTPEKASYSLGGATGNPFHAYEYCRSEFEGMLATLFTVDSVAGQKFSYAPVVRAASTVARLWHSTVSKFWRGYKMVICRDSRVIDTAERPGQVPMVLVFVATRR